MSFRSRAVNDNKYIRLMKIVSSIENLINTRELIKEMRNMLLARKYRKIDVRILQNAGNDITEWTSELNSHRSRLADIRFLVLDQKLRLEAANKAVHKYLMSRYSEQLQKIKGVAERKAYVEDTLDEPLQLLAKLDRLMKLSDEVQKELESSYYSSVLIKNVVEITTRPDRV